MDVKQEDYNLDLSVALREIQSMLKVEAECWFKAEKSKTADVIGQYDVAIELLLTFIRENDIKSFVLVFAKYSITIKGLRSCFYNSGVGVKERRNRAHRLFKNVCSKMVATLAKDAIKKEAASWQIGTETALNFFQGQYAEAGEGIEADTAPNMFI